RFGAQRQKSKTYRAPRCTRTSPLPLLPSGPGGVGGIASRGTRHCNSNISRRQLRWVIDGRFQLSSCPEFRDNNAMSRRTLNPAIGTVSDSTERFFQWSLCLLLLVGFAALMGTNKLDIPSLALVLPAL